MVTVQMGIAVFRPGVLVQDLLQFVPLGRAPSFFQFPHFLPQGQDIRAGSLHKLPDGFLPEVVETLLDVAQPQFPGKFHRAPVGKVRLEQAAQQGGFPAAVDAY